MRGLLFVLSGPCLSYAPLDNQYEHAQRDDSKANKNNGVAGQQISGRENDRGALGFDWGSSGLRSIAQQVGIRVY